MKKIVSIAISLIMIFSVLPTFNLSVSAAGMSDADFFAKFDYSANPALSSVKAFVDQGDYDSAKAALLEYFKSRKKTSSISGFGITKSDEFYGMAVLPMRNILTGPYEFDMWQAEFDVASSSFAEYEVDVTDRIASQLNNGAVSFMLFAGDKQQYPVLVESKESGNAPKLVIEYSIDGEESTVTVTADNDTYISPGNTSATYGTEKVLYIKEDGTGSSSTGSNTCRTYINFPLSDAANSTIISAKLVLSAAYAKDCSTGKKSVLVLNVGDTMWNENTLTWAGTRGSIYSYQNASVPTWGASAPNADDEYHNVTSRFWFGKPMAYEYLSYLEDPVLYNETHPYSDIYPGEDFGPKLVELMDAFASQREYGYTRTLETGERLNRWVDIIDAFLETDVFDTRLDEFCNIISFMWGDCNYLAGFNIADVWSNWKIVASAGFFKAVEYFPEFSTHNPWRKKVEYNVEYTFDQLYNDDYSFTEAGPSYAAWCAKLFGDCIKAANMSGNPMSAAFTEKVKYAARNALESYYPNGYDTNIGDSNFRDQKYYFEMLNEIFSGSDKVIASYANGTDMGAEYLTRYYKNSNSAYMRNSWNPDEAVYINYTNNPWDGHAHPDSNQVLMYAYGSPLLVDSGRYSYSYTNSIHDTLRTPGAHNTIEAVGLNWRVNKDFHSAATSADSFSYANTNDTFDFASSEQHGYSNVSHTRNVFFAKSGFSIVTDYVTGSQSRTYRQNWHFMPSSNASADYRIAKTNFQNSPNITLAAASGTASINNGYHSADYGLVAESEYASFEKIGSTVKFDTLLYPDRPNTQTAVAAEDLAAYDNSKAAVKITIDGKDSYYYVKNTASSDGKFGVYATDAKMAYVSDNEYMIVDGKSVSGKIESLNSICSMGVTLDNGTVTLSGEKLIANSSSDAIKIYAPNTTNVIFNGKSISFTQSGDYIYAVSSAVAESITGASKKVYPAKDGFVASSSGNEGISKRDIIQAACSWQNRNAYMAFDLSDFKGKQITSAVLKMYATEVREDPQNLHFYYLDYGTWTRDNLSFVLEPKSRKMPSHTAGSGTYTGYSYHWEGTVKGAPEKNYIDFTTNLPSYLAANGNYKFTWAILSDSGSVKFSSINATEAQRPYLEITYNYTSSSEPDPTVTVKKYADGVLKSSNTSNAKLGEVYLYEADETVTYNGSKYYIDHDLSNLSTVVQSGDNLVEIYYSSAASVTVNFEDLLGNTIAEPATVWLNPSQLAYTYAPAEIIENDGIIYTLDVASSTLSCSVEDGSVLTAVYKKAYTVTNGTNLVTNGSFENENGFSLSGWLSAETNEEFGSPYRTDYCYAVNSTTAISKDRNSTEPNKTPISTTIPDGEWAFGSRWNDGQNGLCTLKRYVPVAQGKTYLISYKAKHKEGAVGTYLKTSLVASDGANESNTTAPSYIGTEWTSVDRIFTSTDDTDYVLFWFCWLGEDNNSGKGPYWYFDDFCIREVDEVEYINVTIDGKPTVTEGKLFLGEKTDDGYQLPAGIMGYTVTGSDNSVKLVNAGEYAPTDGDIISSVPVNVEMVTGAQVRIGKGLKEDGTVGSNSGLRFIAQINRSNIDDSDFSYGMEISAEGSSKTKDVPAASYQDAGLTTFTVALTDLITSNYNRYYTARPYVNVKYSDGTTAKVYAEESITRSIYQVSVGLLKSGSNGLDDSSDIYGVGENSALYKVLNAYINMVGIRLNLFSNGDISPATSGSGSYRGDVFFSVTSVKNGDNCYRITVTPLADFSYKVSIASYWNDFIRINNNTSVVKTCISNSVISDDGSISFDFTLPER